MLDRHPGLLMAYPGSDIVQAAILTQRGQPARSIARYRQGFIVDFRVPVRLLSGNQDAGDFENG